MNVRVLSLRILMAAAAVNIWTGAPLLGVWVGSRAADSTQPGMGVFALVAMVIFATAIALTSCIGWASAQHDALTGQQQPVRRHVPWLRSMRSERVAWERGRTGLTVLERTLVAVVLVAVGLFELWFFFFSPSPIGAG